MQKLMVIVAQASAVELMVPLKMMKRLSISLAVRYWQLVGAGLARGLAQGLVVVVPAR